MITTYSSRNFNTFEVAHHPEDVIRLDANALFMMGVLQTLKDGLCIKYKKDVRIIITSGYRTQERNTKEKGSENSNHIWSLRQTIVKWLGKPVTSSEITKVACDITSPDVTLRELFDHCKSNIRGEVYMSLSKNFVHIAPCGPIKTPWIQ